MQLRRLFNTILAPVLVPAKPKQKKSSRKKTTKNFQGNGNGQKKNRHSFQHRVSNFYKKSPTQNSGKSVVVYHGTSSAENARSILKHGWIIGSGNAYGDGIYFSKDLSEAKIYAGGSGVYLKCRIYMGKTCQWNTKMSSKYTSWCKSRGVIPDNSAKTSFLLQHGFKTLKEGKIIIVLGPQYAHPSAWKIKRRNIRVISIHRADNDRRIRV